MAYVAGDLLVAGEDASATPVGERFRVEGQLRLDPDSRARIVAVSGTTSDGTIAMATESYEVEGFERAQGIGFECLAPGTVSYETTFTIGDVGDTSPLAGPIGLAGTEVDVIRSGEHTCG